MDNPDTSWENCNLFDCLVDTCEFLEQARHNADMTKLDLVDSCMQRCHFMIKKAVAHPSTTSMSMSGWSIGPPTTDE